MAATASAAVTTPAGLEQLSRQQCIYTACYCEENVYHLLQHLIHSKGRQAVNLFAVFISNSSETVPFWQQQASQQPDGLVVWDYHVVVLEVQQQPQQQQQQQQQHAAAVWDLDTLLPFPCSVQQYAQQALQADKIVLAPQYERCYRVVSAGAFLQRFASDRSHMRRGDGSWMAPPPHHPCIVAQDGCTNNLHCFRDMNTSTQDRTAGTGAVYDSINLPGAGSGNTSGCCAMPASWQDIQLLASNSEYGVVLREQQLLDALLGP
ncbi:hypothetical protein COO60DRAFT_759816 [Scenedesmus sp. NREL 46B-D3]|nr:hypothetical protein COO60DRAFT_759816 [Scenedesmus sp. NREL 46B-D3]